MEGKLSSHLKTVRFLRLHANWKCPPNVSAQQNDQNDDSEIEIFQSPFFSNFALEGDWNSKISQNERIFL